MDDIAAMSGPIDKSELISKLQTLEGLTDEERAALLELAATKRYGLAPQDVRQGVKAIMLSVPLEEARLSAEAVLKRGQWPKFYFTKNGKGGIRRKTYLENVEGRLVTNLWPHAEVGHTDEAKKQLMSLFDGKAPFDTPKPLRLIERILQVAGTKSSTVLDFFAGSGTTLHAVMQLNKEDGGKRQCILVTYNENNICREVTYERNKRVIEGYTTPKGVQVEGLRENNLRYYRTQLLPRERTNRNMRRLVAASTDLLCIKENLFEELKIKNEELRINDVRIFGNGERAMMVIYNEEVIPDIVDWLQSASATQTIKHSSNQAIKVYVFSPGAYAWDDDFAPVIDKVDLCALPEAIYQAYKSVLPKKRADVRGKMEDVREEGGTE